MSLDWQTLFLCSSQNLRIGETLFVCWQEKMSFVTALLLFVSPTRSLEHSN